MELLQDDFPEAGVERSAGGARVTLLPTCRDDATVDIGATRREMGGSVMDSSVAGSDDDDHDQNDDSCLDLTRKPWSKEVRSSAVRPLCSCSRVPVPVLVLIRGFLTTPAAGGHCYCLLSTCAFTHSAFDRPLSAPVAGGRADQKAGGRTRAAQVGDHCGRTVGPERQAV